MRPLDELTHQGRLRRFHGFAREVLDRYRLRSPELTVVSWDENITYRVDTQEGRFLLRLHRPGYRTMEEIRSEHRWLGHLREGPGLLVPEPVPAVDGETVLREDGAGVGSLSFALFRWIEGRFRHEWPSLTPLERVGRLLGRLHEAGRAFEPPPGFSRPTWDPERLCNGGPTLASWDEIGPDHRPVFLQVRDRLLNALPPLFTPDTTILVHGDFHHRNFLFRKGEAAAIDFDDCGWGHPAYDIASALLWFRLRGRGDEAARHLLRGYPSATDPPADLARAVKLFTMARVLTMILWRAGRPKHPSYERWMSLIPRAARRMELWLDGKDLFDV